MTHKEIKAEKEALLKHLREAHHVTDCTMNTPKVVMEKLHAVKHRRI